MNFGAATHPGYIRAGNEDGYFAAPEYAVFVVADGMGGHEHGEVASKLALEVIADRVADIAHAGPTDLPVLLHDAVQAANSAIITCADTQDARSRMGTTLVLATIHDDRLYFAHIGDSRLYLLRSDLFMQLTLDHSLVQAMVDRGEITPEEAAIHPLRHQITRVVGGDEYASPEIASRALEPGDIILLCTDGLSGAVPAETIKAALQGADTAQEKADALIKAALEAGGPDNITAVVISYQRPRAVPVTRPPHQHRLPWWQVLLWSLLALALLAGGGGLLAYGCPRYYVGVDAQNHLALLRRWPLLPMLHAEQVPVPGLLPITPAEAAPGLPHYADDDLQRGISMPDVETGKYLLLNSVPQAIVSQLLKEAKTAVDAGDLPTAQRLLLKAHTYGGDAHTLRQLQVLIDQKAKRQK